MCDYCNCGLQPEIAELTGEHAAIGALADRLASTHRAGDRTQVQRLAADVCRSLGPSSPGPIGPFGP